MSLDPASILFEDHHLIVVNKPAPLLTQAPEGIPCLEAWVKDYIKVKYAKPAGVYLGVPHRLDRPVSGVVLFARNTKAAQRMQALQAGGVEQTALHHHVLMESPRVLYVHRHAHGDPVAIARAVHDAVALTGTPAVAPAAAPAAPASAFAITAARYQC